MKLTKTQTFFGLFAIALIFQLTVIRPIGGPDSVNSQLMTGIGAAIATMIPAFLFIVGTRNWTSRSWIAPALATVVWAALMFVGSR